MHFIFFGDYEQLSKPGGYAIYYGAQAEETHDVVDMKIWFQTEMDKHIKKSSYDLCPTFINRALWTSINMVRTLTVQKRQMLALAAAS